MGGKNKASVSTTTSASSIEKSSPEYFKKYPFVSVCTPTFNRRPFINAIIRCFNDQDYPQDRMEWIIIDDGTDPIEDLVASHPRVKYFKYDTKMTLGRKRNLLHEKSRGEILVYMDDDDYYPPKRVSHAVEMLVSHPDALCAGSSEIYIYFKHIKQMKRFGPYGPNHATAGTFAFKRKLIKNNRYNDDACLAEERAFLKDYTVPLFYMNELEGLLANYEPGRPEMKPDVIAQTLQLEKEREKMAQHAAATGGGGNIVLQQDGQPPVTLNNKQIVDILQALQNDVASRDQEIARLNRKYTMLHEKYQALQKAQAAATAVAAEEAVAASTNTADSISETIYV